MHLVLDQSALPTLMCSTEREDTCGVCMCEPSLVIFEAHPLNLSHDRKHAACDEQELSDVSIYLCRLSDLCHVDLGKALLDNGLLALSRG